MHLRGRQVGIEEYEPPHYCPWCRSQKLYVTKVTIEKSSLRAGRLVGIRDPHDAKFKLIYRCDRCAKEWEEI